MPLVKPVMIVVIALAGTVAGASGPLGPIGVTVYPVIGEPAVARRRVPEHHCLLIARRRGDAAR